LLSKSSILLDIIIIAVTKRNYEASLFPTSRVTRWREETTEHRIIQKFAIFQFLLSLKTRKSRKSALNIKLLTLNTIIRRLCTSTSDFADLRNCTWKPYSLFYRHICTCYS